MRILGHLDRFGPPVGGGVVTTVTILCELARRGHEVCIVTNRTGAPSHPELQVLEAATLLEIDNAYDWAQVLVPHMNVTGEAVERARRARLPVVYPVYDDGQLELHDLSTEDLALVVFCSRGLQERTGWLGSQSVVYPPILVEEHQVDVTGDAISISSLSPEKGGELFWQLADRMPERQFIGVIGGWGEQIIPDSLPINVEVWEHNGVDLRSLFRQTRVLLVPSQTLGEGARYWTENWGRVAIEAACSGIPAIANPAPGPKEALGDSGIFHDRADVDAWVQAIRRLDDPDIYRRQSELARARATELERIVDHQIDGLEFELQRISSATPAHGSIALDQTGKG